MAGMPHKPPAPVPSTPSTGLALGLATYVMWGFFPLYFHALAPAGALEVIAHRATWSLLTAAGVLVVTRRWRDVAGLGAGVYARLAGAGLLIVVNWTAYVYAVQTGRTLDAALGYFINPLLTVLLGRIVLRERTTRLQGLALAFGVVAVVVLAAGLRELPWLALVMPTSFACYSLVKKQVAHHVPPVAGMSIETATVTPIALAYLGYLAATDQASLTRVAAQGPGPVAVHAGLLVGAGIITLIPLATLAAASRHLSLTALGLLQYLSPVLQMLIATLVFHEVVEPARWIGSALVWIGLVVLVIDGLKRRPKRASR